MTNCREFQDLFSYNNSECYCRKNWEYIYEDCVMMRDFGNMKKGDKFDTIVIGPSEHDGCSVCFGNDNTNIYDIAYLQHAREDFEYILIQSTSNDEYKEGFVTENGKSTTLINILTPLADEIKEFIDDMDINIDLPVTYTDLVYILHDKDYWRHCYGNPLQLYLIKHGVVEIFNNWDILIDMIF